MPGCRTDFAGKGNLNVAGQRIHFEYTPFSYEECPADERTHLSKSAALL